MKTEDRRVDPEHGIVLSADGKATHLGRRAAQVLAVLAGAAGECVSKDALMTAAWPGLFVSEDSLYQAIAEIRRGLGADAGQILITKARRGYALAGEHPAAGTAEAPPAAAPIRYTRSADGTRLAWTEMGDGMPVLRTPSWISNIETETSGGAFGDLQARIARKARLVLYDQRGSSLSDRTCAELTLDDMVADIAAVADAAGLDRFVLFGPSQGVPFSVAFAARYPERVIGVIGRGGYARGWLARGEPEMVAKHRASETMVELGWQSENPEFRRFFTARLMPDAPADVARAFDALQARAVDGPAMLANLRLMSTVDVSDIAGEVRCPVLLIHARGDLAVPLENAAELAALAPQSELRIVDGNNHFPVPGTEGYDPFLRAIDDFLDRLIPLWEAGAVSRT